MKKTILNVLMIVCILVAVGCGGYLGYYYYTSYQTENEFDDLRNLVSDKKTTKKTDQTDSSEEFVDVDGVFIQKKFEQLYKKNKDFIGWVTIDDTHIDYPVMYSPSDQEGGEYYIHRDYDGKYSSAGLPFIDANCSVNPATDNIIIYGHNMNAGTMFHDLLQYEDKDFYQKHKTFSFDTIYGDGTYKVVSVIRGQILSDDSTAFKYYEFVNAGSKEEFEKYVENIKAMSLIDTGVEVEYGDELITLSTCAYHVKDGRFAIVAKKIKE